MPFDAQFAEAHAPLGRRQTRGACNYQAGRSAEKRAIMDYEARGYALLEERWRGRAGEVDLIFSSGDEVIFVEVKKSRSFEQAFAALGARQIARLMRAAEEFLGTRPAGSLTPMRFDVAALNQHGDMQVIENALMA